MDEEAAKGQINEEIMRFMRGNYVLDEIPGKYYDIPCLKFRQGKRTILSINIHEDHYDFQIILGKAEREKFEAIRHELPTEITELYDSERTLHDGKWLLIRVDDLQMLEAVKKLILIKKRPNRKPFPKENAVISSCGHRCDMCVHYNGGTVNDELRAELKERLIRVYAGGVGDGGWWGDDMMFCDGCDAGGLDKSFGCESLKCARENGVAMCQNCAKHPCKKAYHMYAGLKPEIHTNTISAEDVTKIILPYVHGQYGN